MSTTARSRGKATALGRERGPPRREALLQREVLSILPINWSFRLRGWRAARRRPDIAIYITPYCASWRGAAGRQGMLHQLPHHRTVGRHPDPPIGLLGDKPAQYGKAARARLEGGLATRKGRIVIGEPTFGQRLAKAAFHFRPKEPLPIFASRRPDSLISGTPRPSATMRTVVQARTRSLDTTASRRCGAQLAPLIPEVAGDRVRSACGRR